MWQRSRLQFAEFDKQCGVHDIDVRGGGQLKQLSKDHLNNEKHLKPVFTFNSIIPTSHHVLILIMLYLHNVIVEGNLIFAGVAE